MKSVILRCLSSTVLLSLISLPALSDGFRYAQMPEELFLLETSPLREAPAEIVTVGRDIEPPKTITSFGRQVRLVGIPFWPDAGEAIDFAAANETAWWSSLVEQSLAAWFAPVKANDAPALASADTLPRLDTYQTAASFIIE